jgi:hypothetical protein
VQPGNEHPASLAIRAMVCPAVASRRVLPADASEDGATLEKPGAERDLDATLEKPRAERDLDATLEKPRAERDLDATLEKPEAESR